MIASVWGEGAETMASFELLRAYSHFGNPVIGALSEDKLCGVSIGFLAPAGGLHLHSHITGVSPARQHLGVGFGLKVAQRAWCLDQGITEVTWTFDPLLARNAHFNIRKLGAVAGELIPEFYGDMPDALNSGDVSDRLVVQWPLRSARVEEALRRAPGAHDQDQAAPAGPPSPEVARTVQVPDDYHTLRRRYPASAARWRMKVREELLAAFANGLQIVDFDAQGRYLLGVAQA